MTQKNLVVVDVADTSTQGAFAAAELSLPNSSKYVLSEA